MTLTLALGNLAYLVTAGALIVRDMLWLRVLGVLGNLGFIAADFASKAGPNWSFMAWSSLFVAINGTQIVLLILERRDTALSEPDRELHAAVFANIPVGDFRRLIAFGRRVYLEPGTVLAEEGGRRPDVLLIEHGRIDVFRNGRCIERRVDGDMVGEMAFVTNRPFLARLVVATSTQAIAWERGALTRLFARRPSLALGFHASFISHLQEANHSAEPDG